MFGFSDGNVSQFTTLDSWHSWLPEEESPDFESTPPACWGFHLSQLWHQNLVKSQAARQQIQITFISQSPDFFSTATRRLIFVVMGEISKQRFDPQVNIWICPKLFWCIRFMINPINLHSCLWLKWQSNLVASVSIMLMVSLRARIKDLAQSVSLTFFSVLFFSKVGNHYMYYFIDVMCTIFKFKWRLWKSKYAILGDLGWSWFAWIYTLFYKLDLLITIFMNTYNKTVMCVKPVRHGFILYFSISYILKRRI